MGRSQNENVNEPPFCNRRRRWRRGAVNHLVRGVSSICPHRFDAGFVPTAKPDRDAIIVTRNSPLISAVSRKRSGEYSSAAALSSAMAVAGGHC
jgi:hypothetical protein